MFFKYLIIYFYMYYFNKIFNNYNVNLLGINIRLYSLIKNGKIK